MLIICLALIIPMVIIAPSAKAAPEISAGIAIYIEDQLVGMDTMPYVSQGTTFVPIRFISEEIGASITWKNPRAEIIYGDTTIVMQADSKTVSVNGKEETLPVPVQVRDGRLLVPLRFISESFGFHVDYKNNEIDIDTGRASPNGKSYNCPFDIADKKEGIYYLEYDREASCYCIAFVDKESFTTTILISGLHSSASSVNVIGQYIYYDDGGKFIRYDMQTHESEILAQKIYRAYVTGNTVYYLDTQLELGGLWKMDINGGNQMQIAKYIYTYIVVGGNVFLPNTTNTNKDGYRSLTYSNGYTYYEHGEQSGEGSFNTYSVLTRAKDGDPAQSPVLTLEDNSAFANIQIIGNWIYYVPQHEAYYFTNHAAPYSGNLFRESLNGQIKEQLTNVKTGDFYIFKGGYCYIDYGNFYNSGTELVFIKT